MARWGGPSRSWCRPGADGEARLAQGPGVRNAARRQGHWCTAEIACYDSRRGPLARHVHAIARFCTRARRLPAGGMTKRLWLAYAISPLGASAPLLAFWLGMEIYVRTAGR